MDNIVLSFDAAQVLFKSYNDNDFTIFIKTNNEKDEYKVDPCGLDFKIFIEISKIRNKKRRPDNFIAFVY